MSCFASLTRSSKIRTAVFLIAAACITAMAVNCVHAYQGYQMEEMFKGGDGRLEIDGADFTWLFMSGLNFMKYTLIIVVLAAYTVFMVVFSAIISLSMRLIGLRKVRQDDMSEYKISGMGFIAVNVIGLIISLIITKGGLLLAILLFFVPQLLIVWAVYLSDLKKKSVQSAHGHFVEDTKQDLTQL